ncbi:type II toxin-antitoxin system HicB family antitoxin [Clostridium sp. Mt-5]|uniref:Type II toxin-antitoxin system HicB family antitoxin n=1 Tax=Clostridium moutaii TaxID=3240932 RepID=A0ABV4BRM5_9CLOT
MANLVSFLNFQILLYLQSLIYNLPYKDNIDIIFPNLPGCVSNADSMDEAVKNAKEVLALHLFGMEEDNIQIPLLVDVYMPLYRETTQNTSVKTTITMPQWLKSLAEKNNINFSQVIQTAIKQKLDING